jgi:hypothetical protein
MSTSASYTYTELLAAIQDWVDDDSAPFVARLPNIISLAESRVATDLNLELLERVTTGALTPSSRTQAILDADVQAVRSINIRDSGGTGVFRPLRMRTFEYLLDYAPDDTVLGEPRFWAYRAEGATVITDIDVAPVPDDSYEYTIRSLGPPEALSAENENTWIGDNAGDLLLWQALFLAESWLKSDQAGRWQQMYTDLLATRRVILREVIRSGDYNFIKPAPKVVDQ